MADDGRHDHLHRLALDLVRELEDRVVLREALPLRSMRQSASAATTTRQTQT